MQRDVPPLLDQPNDEGLVPIEARAAPPIRARAIHRIAVEIPTPNLAAACRADSPSVEAFRTRTRRSSLKARAIIRLPQQEG